MKFSVVTISFNQNEFLERAIQSVVCQTGVEIEYIVCDPGSTDGSRDIIERYRPQIACTVLERDSGPADGLNKGFQRATGDVFCYLNSDDVFEPQAFQRVARYLEQHPSADVVCGHAWVVDRHDSRLRRVWSEPYRPSMVAYGAAVQIQPSTFIRRDAFLKSGGFNVENRSNWDGELLIDLYQTGAKFAIIDEFLSQYRLHEVSITNSGRLDQLINEFADRRFQRLMGRPFKPADRSMALLLKLVKHTLQPKALLERVKEGPLYKRGAH